MGCGTWVGRRSCQLCQNQQITVGKPHRYVPLRQFSLPESIMRKGTSSKAYQFTNQALLGPKCCSSFCVTLSSLFLKIASHPIIYTAAEPENEPVKFSGASGNMVFMLQEKPVWKQGAELSERNWSSHFLCKDGNLHTWVPLHACLIWPLTSCPLQHFLW